MFIRALIAFFVLPGVAAFIVPVIWLWYAGSGLGHPQGLVVLLLGTFMLLWCVRDFYIAGKGTLAPWSPPRNLVEIGLYRYSRNPMYISVVLVLIGWTVSCGSVVLLAYTAIIAIAFHLRVVFGEEPWLAHTHGEAWVHYASRVPRWLWKM